MTESVGAVPYERVAQMSTGKTERMAAFTARIPGGNNPHRPPIDQEYHRFKAPTEKRELPYRIATYSEGLVIRNNTDREIHIRGRDGTLLSLRPDATLPGVPKGIYYSIGFRKSPNVLIDNDRHDGVKNMLNGRILNACNATGRCSQEVNDVEHWYVVTIDDIVHNGGTVYLEEIDKIVSIRDRIAVAEHPFTLTGIDEALERMVQQFTRAAAGVMLYVIDNDNEFGERFVNINGIIMAVKPIIDTSRPSGVYMKVAGIKRKQGLEIYEFSTLNDKCPIRFFRTVGEAEIFGSETEAKRQQLEETKLETELKIVEATTQQKLASVTRADQKDRLDMISSQRKDEYDERATVRKDTYDQRSTERKDESEESKAAIAALGAAVAVGGIGWKVISSARKSSALGGLAPALSAVPINSVPKDSVLSSVVPAVITAGAVNVLKTHALSTVVQTMGTRTVLKLGLSLIGG